MKYRHYAPAGRLTIVQGAEGAEEEAVDAAVSGVECDGGHRAVPQALILVISTLV